MVSVVTVLTGPLALALGLGLAAVVAAACRVLDAGSGLTDALTAATVLVVVVGLVAWRWRRDGLPRLRPSVAAGRPVAGVTALVAASAGLVYGVDAAAGGMRVLAVDLGALALFLVLNTVIALALEAVPEELALRGHTFGVLQARGWGSWSAGALTTALFVVIPCVGIALGAVLGTLLGLPTPPATSAPGGQDPVAYAVLLAVFGTLLGVVRSVTGSVAACVAAHLVVLTVNRILLDPTGERTGVTVALPPGGEALILVYLAVAAAAVALAERLTGVLSPGAAARRRADPAAAPARR